MAEETEFKAVAKPTLIFDGGCSFCRRWKDRWKSLTGEAIEFVPSQSVKDRFPQIPEGGFDESVWLVESDGRTTHGAEAVFRSLSLAGTKRWMLWAYERLPLFKPISEALYRLLSNHRGIADRLDTRFIPESCDQSRSYIISGNLLLRAIGLVYLIALISLRGQIDGLIGSQGILPAQTYLNDIPHLLPPGATRMLYVPTLFWFNSSDAALHLVCNIGIGCGILLMLGILPVVNSIALWAIYLSLTNVSQMFLGYQWDSLLLEAGFLAIFLSPLGLTIGLQQPSRVVMFLFRWLLFRLMLLSGLVKIASGDHAWRSLAAMKFHYMTQPLPTWTSWYMHQQPGWFASLSTALVLIIEIAAPLFIFAVRRRRIAALILLVMLQLLIAATGNYGFFNLLALVLCLTLIDDWSWRKLKLARKERDPVATMRWPLWITVPLTVVLIDLSIISGDWQLGGQRYLPDVLITPAFYAQPFRVANGYGLFASMTTTRNELVVEGSNDGQTWLPYEFKWKPGDVHNRPRFCAPGMPRLDWQMWFASLSPSRYATMIYGLLDGIKADSKPVLDLLATNPFPDKPPRYLRIMVYDYRFTTPAERAHSGAWWSREELGQLSIDGQTP